MTSLSICNVGKQYHKGATTLENINLEIRSGEFLILVGPSGCGKSTLMNMIAGLEEVSSGQILLNDHDITHAPPAARDIAMVFQSYALYPNMSVYDNIAFGLQIRKWPKSDIETEVQRVAKMLQIDHLLSRKPAQLSGGQQQRVAMGRALARRPKVYLFDEPLSNLDAKLRVEMRTEVKKLHQRLGTTIVYVTHDQIEAMTLADRIAVMKDGVIQQLGTPQEIYQSPNNLFVASFIGSPAMNFIPVTVERNDQGLFVQLSDSGGQRLNVPLRADLPATVGQELILGLRPEAITEVQPHRLSQADTFQGQFMVEMTEPTGPDTLTLLRINQREVTARIAPQANPQAGHSLALMLDASQALFFEPSSGERLRASPQQRIA
ncbi:ABC transporter ATP-binding protein [Atopomonas sediminilitoris]|uniref:ABC transporter ATP-binding protein n=1 Tax=Atopomonas sediminilitoris TaxID=2919919 RepID=UPI001F4DC94C|nr:sn-glycerol-3-phosphate ABC transporter ATP-binding protein UgpC [Atopomonas sediminilitoris]MCJ8168758.1 sn-glycerol-3-phosphate ABC transporter ATP-binding protein UgpC [Atopomonas sediminilitoris]